MNTQKQSTVASAHYTVIIRLPFPRNGFEDPPPVEWDATKDEALWKMISKASHSKDLDWESISIHFGVTLPFLLQQSAWLYERHFERMRLQMKKLGTTPAATEPSSPQLNIQGDDNPAFAPILRPGAAEIARMGSAGSFKKPTALEKLFMVENLRVRADSTRATTATTPRLQGAFTPTETKTSMSNQRAVRPEVARNASNTTITQSNVYATTSKQQPFQRVLRGSRGSSGSHNRPGPSFRMTDSSQGDENEFAVAYEDALSRQPSKTVDVISSDPELDGNPPKPTSRMIQRPQQQHSKQQVNKAPLLESTSSDGEDDDSGGGYLPFASVAQLPARGVDPAATIRGINSKATRPSTSRATATSKREPIQPPQHLLPDSSNSSINSALQPPVTTARLDGGDAVRDITDRPSALSPRHRAQLEQLSPRSRRSGSEGSPSIGSSFSDLENTSITQSALEDALLSNMQHGSIGMSLESRIGSLKDVLGRR